MKIFVMNFRPMKDLCTLKFNNHCSTHEESIVQREEAMYVLQWKNIELRIQ